MVLFVLALAGCGKNPQTTPPATPSANKQPTINEQVIGSWRSENVGLDFPIWMVDTYNADGTATTDFYSKPKNAEADIKNKTIQQHWQIVNNALEVGEKTPGGEFQRQGMARPLVIDVHGKLTGIAEWKRVDEPKSLAGLRPFRIDRL
jgi:hypothetical protein